MLKLDKNNRGFTIIEVMIVLAIAGLIILIVLLAVPALQRNSRNTAMKNDAAAIAGGVTEFASNNDGAMPLAANSGNVSGTVTLDNANGSEAVAQIQGSTAYSDADGAANGLAATAGAIIVRFGAKCPANAGGATVDVTANTRSAAIIYAVEGSGGAVTQRCLDS
jgi:prepilin-type N-terminal cleavage/methylation domain-containing protein